mgnify:CR=1 FL=1
MPGQLRILCIGAHPDDCDLKVGGLAIKYARLGHRVKFVSLCNGNAGHHQMGGGPLARRRYAETQRSAAIASAGASGFVEYTVLDISDCQLYPTMANRDAVISIIREFRADLVITNRPNDYMADHRYTSQLVQDAAYIVTVPNVVALTPHLNYNPVFAFWSDEFQLPYPFRPHVAVSIDDVIETKTDMLMCHESQFFEWLPYNMNVLDQVPQGEAERRSFLKAQWLPMMEREADNCRESLQRLYGEQKGAAVRYAEGLEFCEYGRKVTEDEFGRLFPFYG